MKEIGIVCANCHHIYKWVDERKPNFCPECGIQTQYLKRVVDESCGSRVEVCLNYTIIDGNGEMDDVMETVYEDLSYIAYCIKSKTMDASNIIKHVDSVISKLKEVRDES